jgi:hypothetical protein
MTARSRAGEALGKVTNIHFLLTPANAGRVAGGEAVRKSAFTAETPGPACPLSKKFRPDLPRQPNMVRPASNLGIQFGHPTLEVIVSSVGL